MINFRQKEFAEYDAMRSLYVKLMRYYQDRNKLGIIDSSALVPILRGNNVVIERFVITTSLFGKDRYRMYLKIGAKAKLPDEVRLPGRVNRQNLGRLELTLEKGIFENNNNNNPNNNNGGNNYKNNKDSGNTSLGKGPKQKNHSEITLGQKNFGKGGGPRPYISGKFSPFVNMSYEVQELLGDAVKYDKKSRSLVLEFDTIDDAVNALNILPFGLGYKIYLLNA